MIGRVGDPIGELLEQGTDALRAGDASRARVAFERALAERRTDQPEGPGLEGLARSAYLDLEHLAAIDLWERAYAAHRAEDDRLSARSGWPGRSPTCTAP